MPSAYSSSNIVIKSEEIINLYGTLDCLWHRVYSEDVVEAKATVFITDQDGKSHTQMVLHNFASPKRTYAFLFCADNVDHVGKYHIASAKVVWEELK